MNPSRSILMLVSRIPPRAMLLIVLVGAGATTFLVMNEFDRQHKAYQTDLAAARMKPPEVVREVVQPEESAPATIESKLKTGQRAVTITVDSASTSGGLIKPDCHVDIMTVLGNGLESNPMPILSDVSILAVSGPSVTVAVDSGDALRLLKAASAGRLYLTLRNESDRAPVPTYNIAAKPEHKLPIPAPPAIPQTIIRTVEVPAKPVTKKAQPVVEQWAGSKREEVTLQTN